MTDLLGWKGFVWSRTSYSHTSYLSFFLTQRQRLWTILNLAQTFTQPAVVMVVTNMRCDNMYIVQCTFMIHISTRRVWVVRQVLLQWRGGTWQKKIIEKINVWNYFLLFEGGGGPKQVVVPCHLWKGNPQGKHII